LSICGHLADTQTIPMPSDPRTADSAYDRLFSLMPRFCRAPYGNGSRAAAHQAESGAERLAELSSLIERLTRVIRPTYIPVWLSKLIAALNDDKPMDRIAKGDYRAVARLISGLEDQAQADVPLTIAVATVRGCWVMHTPRIPTTT
jgi:hypothetical protein